jgi:prophage antirepressor-like protein
MAAEPAVVVVAVAAVAVIGHVLLRLLTEIVQTAAARSFQRARQRKARSVRVWDRRADRWWRLADLAQVLGVTAVNHWAQKRANYADLRKNKDQSTTVYAFTRRAAILPASAPSDQPETSRRHPR